MLSLARFVFLVAPFRIFISMFLGSRHFMTFLILLELLRVAIFVCLCLYRPVE